MASKLLRPFEAAHTLERQIDAGPSRHIHGRTYNAEVTLRGAADATSGMVVDLGGGRATIDVTRDKLVRHPRKHPCARPLTKDSAT